MKRDIREGSTLLRAKNKNVFIHQTQRRNDMGKVLVMDHPLIQHKIGIIRRKETSFQRIPGAGQRSCHVYGI